MLFALPKNILRLLNPLDLALQVDCFHVLRKSDPPHSYLNHLGSYDSRIGSWCTQSPVASDPKRHGTAIQFDQVWRSKSIRYSAPI
ncbi:hypothetical protein Hanom_Chr00s017225g01756871 [Helianthus anomalus]